MRFLNEIACFIGWSVIWGWVFLCIWGITLEIEFRSTQRMKKGNVIYANFHGHHRNPLDRHRHEGEPVGSDDAS